MRGRKPQLAIVEGGAGSVPAAPSWLPPAAQAEWHRIMPALMARIIDADLGLVESYCLAAGQVRACQRVITDATMFVQSDRSAARPHPAFRLMHSAMAEARRLAAELGIGPVARHRAGPGRTGDDELGDFDL